MLLEVITGLNRDHAGGTALYPKRLVRSIRLRQRVGPGRREMHEAAVRGT